MPNVSLKLQATRALVARLNPARKAYWTNLLDQRAKVAVGAEADVEWDLAAANWLDRVYTAVSDEATRVRREGVDALTDTTSAIGFGLWPFAVAALAIGYALALAKQGKRR